MSSHSQSGVSSQFRDRVLVPGLSLSTQVALHGVQGHQLECLHLGSGVSGVGTSSSHAGVGRSSTSGISGHSFGQSGLLQSQSGSSPEKSPDPSPDASGSSPDDSPDASGSGHSHSGGQSGLPHSSSQFGAVVVVVGQGVVGAEVVGHGVVVVGQGVVVGGGVVVVGHGVVVGGGVVVVGHGVVVIENLTRSSCLSIIEGVHGEVYSGRTLYCSGIIPFSPDKDSDCQEKK